jgi:hypothetical protein
MDRDTRKLEYETPRIEDHGDLTELTAAGHPAGHFDANYSEGQVIPPGGAGTSP